MENWTYLNEKNICLCLMDNNMTPLISVIVPVYNVEKYIEKAIISLQEQSFHRFEVLIIDDGSKDKSISIAQSLVENDEKFLFFTKTNGGLSDARNYGIGKAKGEYLAFLDSDDYFEEGFLEKMYARIVKDDADMAICDFRLVSEEGKMLSVQNTNVSHRIDAKEAVQNNLKAEGINAGVCNKLYKKILFTDIKFPVNMYYEDYSTTVKLLLSSQRITFVNEILFNYVQREGSITNSLSQKNIDDRFTVYDDMKNYLCQAHHIETFQREIIISYLQYVILSGAMQIVKNSATYQTDIAYLLKKADKSIFTIRNILLFYTFNKRQMFALLVLKSNIHIFKWVTLQFRKKR